MQLAPASDGCNLFVCRPFHVCEYKHINVSWRPSPATREINCLGSETTISGNPCGYKYLHSMSPS